MFPHHNTAAIDGFLVAHHHDNVCYTPKRRVFEQNGLIPYARGAPDTQHATPGATKYYRPQTASSPVTHTVEEEW